MPLNQQTFNRVLYSFQIDERNGALVALSGGLDSVVLCHLLFHAGMRFSIAHVNYGLRASESDQDELFAASVAKRYGVDFYSKKIDPESDVHFQNRGIQEAARTLRYTWFQELIVKSDFSCIMTAHHKDDQAETIIFQFVRGGLISALRGMKTQNGNLCRPLLSFTRDEILAYASAHHLQWREDASNAETKYARNYVRNKIIPGLKELNPGIVDSLSKRSAIFEEIERMTYDVIQRDIKQHTVESDDSFSLDVNWLSLYPYKRLLLWTLLEPYHFSSAQVDEAIFLADATSGARLESETHVLWKEQQMLLLKRKDEITDATYIIEKWPFYVDKNQGMRIEECGLSDVEFDRTNEVIFLDADKLQMPITLRPCKTGDKFIPLGMKGHQLVSDFLTQKKIPQRLKRRVYVMESEGSVAAVIGFRPDERFKTEPSTKRVLRICGGLKM